MYVRLTDISMSVEIDKYPFLHFQDIRHKFFSYQIWVSKCQYDLENKGKITQNPITSFPIQMVYVC